MELYIASIVQPNEFIAANVITASTKGINDSPLNFLFSLLPLPFFSFNKLV